MGNNYSKILLLINNEPIEKCNNDSCVWNIYKEFKNEIVKKLYKEMIDNYDRIFKIDSKCDKLKINIDWYDDKFNNDLFDYDLNNIKESIKDCLFTSKIISRKDKYFNNNYLDIIQINRYGTYDNSYMKIFIHFIL